MSTSSTGPASLPNVAEDVELLLSVYAPSIRPTSLTSDLSTDGSSHGPYNGLDIVQANRKKRVSVHVQGKRSRHATTISMLSDNVMLEIFDFCQKNYVKYSWFTEAIWDWRILVHVCKRWRQVVFGSPLRLNLRILCTHGTPVRKHLDILPTFPIHIEYIRGKPMERNDEDNVIAAFDHINRVSSVGLCLTVRQLGKIVTVMQEPFPALKKLYLKTHISNDTPALPCEFLGRSAPNLQEIRLVGAPFPALQGLLLSTSDLVTLHLLNIPQTGYISPEAMVAALASLSRLEGLAIGFQSPASRPDQIHLPPVTRTVLPTLTFFYFRGVREYLEDFVARISAPLLATIEIDYFNQLVDFEVPQLWWFINHSEDLRQASTHCFVSFQDDRGSFCAGPRTHILESEPFDDFPCRIHVSILCKGIDWQVSHTAPAPNQISAALSNLLHFAITADDIRPELDDMDGVDWLQLLRPFSSVQTLFVSREFAGQVSRSLDDIPEVMATELLPALDMLCLEDQPVSSAHRFIAARWESGRPVTTVNTRKAFEERLISYLD
ncbi:hypothetical protein V8E53_013872 [Lactarius tabidus]